MRVLSGLFKVVVGLIFGLLCGVALSPAFAAFQSADLDDNTTLYQFLLALLIAIIVFFGPTIRRAFGRGMLLFGCSILALPISAMLLAGRASSDLITEAEGEAAAIIGSGIASVLVTGFSAFVGFFVGSIIIVIGLVLSLGGRREVVVVQTHRVEPR